MGNFANWSNSQTMQLQGQVLKQSGQRAMDAAQVAVNNAIQNRDFGSAKGAIDTLVTTGVLTPESGQLRLQEIENNVKAGMREDATNDARSLITVGEYEAAADAIRSAPFTDSEKRDKLASLKHEKEVSDLMVIANDDPKRAMELATTGEQSKRITGPDRVRIMNAAQNRQQALRADALKNYSDEIKLGIADKEKFAARILDDSNLTERDRAELVTFLDRGPVNDPVTYARLYAEAKQFEGAEGSPEYANFLNRVDMALDGDSKSSVLGTLAESVKAPKTMQSRAINAVYASLSDQLKEGWFGEYRGRLDDPQTVLPENMRNEIATLRDQLLYSDASKAERERALSDPEYMKYWEREARKKWHDNLADKNKGFFTGYMIDDAARKQKAAERYQNVLADLEQWHRQHQDATAAELRAKAGDLTAEARKQAKLNNDATLLMPTPAAEPDAKSVLDRIKKIK